jgi:hypothetical protein
VKVGDLVKVKPASDGLYMITSLAAQCMHTKKKLSNAVTIVCLDDSSPPMPMNKKWIEIISEAR